MSVFSMAASNPAAPTYPLQRSVRLRSSASAYFNRTVASTTNTWTFSAWVKRGALGTSQTIAATRSASAGGSAGIYFNSNDTINITLNTVGVLTTTAVYRDPSAWYHIQVSVTQSGASYLYVNGIQIGTWTSGATSFLFNSAATWVNAIGRNGDSATSYFDGYLEEVNFIDGQALAPTSFGAYNSYGVWSPAKYTGTYGTNGFYLSFQDNSALTTTANVGIGADSSGNGNYWTSNNISLTAGVTYDSMLDVPTLSSNTNANYAVMNPLKIYTSNLGLTNGNLRLSDSNAVVTSAISTMSFGTSGKYYFECTMVAVATANSNYVGVIDATNGFGTAPFQNKGEYRSTGDIYNIAGTAQTVGASYTTNDVIGVAVDVTNGTVQFYKNNVAQGATPSFTFTAGTELWAAISTDNQVGTKTYAINFGQQPFTYTPPTGYNRLCTYNLPDSIVPVGAQYMAATTYTGNNSSTGTSRSITNGGNNTLGTTFQPDFVWIKNRSNAYSHNLYDSVRGSGSARDLQTDTTNSEATNATNAALYGYLSAFNSNGFTTTNGTDATSPGIWVNQNAQTFVAWQWRASNASAVTNTAGSISSQVSANQTAGFSVVTYTGTGVNGATVGHGLGVAPRMFIVKSRSNVRNWQTYHASIGNTGALYLNTTNATVTASTNWNNTSPTSSVISLGTDGNVNVNAETYVAYCFAAVPGYSAFGSYTGNGSADGPFVFLGFRPRWIMIKRTDTTANWRILDTSRSTFNVESLELYPNLSNAEGTFASLDGLSNGFKIRNTDTAYNTNGGTYIYAAFAENPFKNSLAR